MPKLGNKDYPYTDEGIEEFEEDQTEGQMEDLMLSGEEEPLVPDSMRSSI